MKHKLKIIIGSTRPGRKGTSVAQWIFKIAGQHGDFDAEVLDLAEINLPFLDEPEHPRLNKYLHQHTRDWSAKIKDASAVIAVTPEYNYGYPASLKNAFDFLYNEWNYKPIVFVSYGGAAGGTRSVQQLRQVVIALKMIPLEASVVIPSFIKYIDVRGIFNPDERMAKSAQVMLNELSRWSGVLKSVREAGK